MSLSARHNQYMNRIAQIILQTLAAHSLWVKQTAVRRHLYQLQCSHAPETILPAFINKLATSATDSRFKHALELLPPYYRKIFYILHGFMSLIVAWISALIIILTWINIRSCIITACRWGGYCPWAQGAPWSVNADLFWLSCEFSRSPLLNHHHACMPCSV